MHAVQDPAGASARGRVLIVDDNRDVAESMALLLEYLGARVEVAHDGPAALRAIESETPGLILLDIGMPGMDGYDVARRIRQQPRFDQVLLVALSGWGPDDERPGSSACEFDHYLLKPVDMAALKALLALP